MAQVSSLSLQLRSQMEEILTESARKNRRRMGERNLMLPISVLQSTATQVLGNFGSQWEEGQQNLCQAQMNFKWLLTSELWGRE